MNATVITTLPGPAPTMRLGRVLHAYVVESKYQFLQMLRAPAFAFPFLVLPAVLYGLFGVLFAGSSPDVKATKGLADYLYSGWCTFAVMGPAIFGIGCGLAV